MHENERWNYFKSSYRIYQIIWIAYEHERLLISNFLLKLVLEKCEKHDIATQSDFTSFISLPKTNDSRTFRFYSVAEKKIRFALTAVPEGVQDNFYAAEYFTFGKNFYAKHSPRKY